MSDMSEKVSETKNRVTTFAKAAPKLFDGFSRLAKAATSEGSFSAAQKELIATGMAVTQGCEDCILYHVDAAKKHGAKEADLVEILEVAVEMGGGPAVMYAAKALEVFRGIE